MAADPERLPEGMEPGFDARYTLHQESMNFPNGCHVCEVEVDKETELVEIVRYTACEDDGVLLKPADRPRPGAWGVAQGLGQALLENLVYDPETGQLLTGTYMDYGMPRAHHLAPLEAVFNPIPCRTNDLGVKGVGGGGRVRRSSGAGVSRARCLEAARGPPPGYAAHSATGVGRHRGGEARALAGRRRCRAGSGPASEWP